MTTSLDTRMIPKVAALVARLGKTVTFLVRTAGTYNPSTRVYDGEAFTPKDKKVVPPWDYKIYEIDNKNVMVGDSRIGLPAQALDFTPIPKMEVLIDNNKWRIVNVENIYTGDLVALYVCQLRR